MLRNNMIRLKYDHSHRVAALCGRIASALCWSGEDKDAAVTMGLLHDVGRFAQYSKYRTFSDNRSENHGEAGYELITSSGLLDGLDARLAHAILMGVRYHNRREVPAFLEDDNLNFVRLIRDADKLDIFGIFDEAIRDESFAGRLKSALNIEIEGAVNPAALEDVMRDETVANDHISNGMDFLVMMLSWVFDLNYMPSNEILAESGTLDLITGRLPDNPAVRKAADHVLKYFTATVAR